MSRAIAWIALLSVSTAWGAGDSWIEQSNRHAQVLLDITARYGPEQAASFGVEGHDAEIFDLKPRAVERQLADLDAAVQRLERLRQTQADRRVLQDLDILIRAAQDQRIATELGDRFMLPFFDLGRAVFVGFQDLLEPRVDKRRHGAALARLRRYTGTQPGFEPITVLARARYEERANDQALLGPWVVEVQQYLENQPRYLDGIEQLLKGSGLKGWQKDLQVLRRQFDEYGDWVRNSVLPRARPTSPLPAPLYAHNLKLLGVQMDPRELMERALASFAQTRAEMESVARRIADQRGLEDGSYKAVIRELKRQRIAADQLLNVYSDRLEQLEAIIRREQLVTLPRRKAVIRLATEAESAASPAPYIDPPRLIGNTGEPLEFVLPVSNPNAASGAAMDDFNYDAIAWALTAHEARPGHELQFASILERGISTARVIYAFNSANVEGWALYAESVVKEYLPLEGQLGVLQMRLLREARAFLDPMVNLGMMEPAAAQRFLMEQVMLSEPMAKQEADRYAFTAPGQATSYFYGFSKLNALRTRVELTQGERFNELRYHDFLIDQGLLPLDLLEQAVMKEFLTAK